MKSSKQDTLQSFAFWFSLFVLMCVLVHYANAQQKLTPSQQIQQLKAEVEKLNILLASEQDKYRKEIIKNAVLNGKIQGVNDGIDKATGILQKGYNSGKLNYKEIWDCGFRINIDTSSVYQRPGNGKDRKDKK